MTNPLRPFGLYILNTTVIFLGSVIGLLFSCSLAGYAFAKFKFRGQRVLFAFVIFTQLIPPAVGFVPLFIEMVQFIGAEYV